MSSTQAQREFFLQVAESATAAITALYPPSKTSSDRPRQIRSRRLQTRLRHQREILEKLNSGSVSAEEALILLLEDETPIAPASKEYSTYLGKLSGDLKNLKLKLPLKKKDDRDELE